MKPKRPKPARDLSPEAQKLWKRIAAEIVIDEAAGLLLNSMCQAWDRLQQAREILRTEGVTLTDRFGQTKTHPCCAIEHNALMAVSRCWRLLGFDLVPPGLEGR